MKAKKNSSAKKSNPKTRALLDVFEKSGFIHIESDFIEMTFEGLTSEIDHIFAHENIIIICEKTTLSDISDHFPKKKDYHEKAHEKKSEFIKSYQEKNINFKNYISDKPYSTSDYEMRSLYYSENKGFSEGIISNCKPFALMSSEICKYFKQLADTIGYSARYELFKYLDISLGRVGDNRLKGRRPSSSNFDAFAIPGRHTNYPENFILTSFYIDPETLIKQAYVLRRHGWETADHSYQRLIQKSKIKKMREYLSKEGKVFINNLIITLPNTVIVKDPITQSPLKAREIDEMKAVELSIPEEHGTIGIIDGQHRIYAYHEGSDEFNEKISNMRDRQNLLATAIIFPSDYTQQNRIKFEAELFLKINNTQTNITDSLKQDLETIINPESPLAIAKIVASKLAEKGPLLGHVQASVYDDKDKIKTASAVRYALQPIINPQSKASLFSTWPDSSVIVSEKNSPSTSFDIPDYTEFCAKTLNKAFAGLKQNLMGRWAPKTRGRTDLVLTPTLIGGVFVYIRLAIESKICPNSIDYPSTFLKIEGFNFNSYSSSKWAALGKALYEKYPPKTLDPLSNSC